MRGLAGGIVISLAIAVMAGCGRPAARDDGSATRPEGAWRAALGSPGGELPFGLEFNLDDSPAAVIVNGGERLPFSDVRLNGREIVLEIAGYDSRIEASVTPDGRTMEGQWSKRSTQGRSMLPFSATRGRSARFPVASPPAGSVEGAWKVTFIEDNGTRYPARAEFEQNGERVLGTFLTETGDYRYLEGAVAGRTLSLSCFDGAHAFLFRAQLGEGELLGDFWSRDTYHARWEGTRIAPGEDQDTLRDPFERVTLSDPGAGFPFAFPDTGGAMVTSDDARFRDKVVLIDVFGTWCPNCNDLAGVLRRWDREYGPRGLEIVGLAYEFTGDWDQDAEMVRRFGVRHQLQFPLLVAGTSDKADAAATLRGLGKIESFPTLVFVDRKGVARWVHSGYDGPATGEHHARSIRRIEQTIEQLLAEPPARDPVTARG